MSWFNWNKKKRANVLEEVNPKIFPQEELVKVTDEYQTCSAFPQVFIDQANDDALDLISEKKVLFFSSYLYIESPIINDISQKILITNYSSTFKNISDIVETYWAFSEKDDAYLKKIIKDTPRLLVNGFVFSPKLEDPIQSLYVLPVSAYPLNLYRSLEKRRVITTYKFHPYKVSGAHTPTKDQLELMVEEYGQDNINDLYKVLNIDLTEVTK